MTDTIRFALMSLVAATFPMLGILGIVNLSPEQELATTAFITQFVLLASLVFKKGQSTA